MNFRTSSGRIWPTRGRLAAVLGIVSAAALSARADSTFVYAVQLSASVSDSPPQITLAWEPDPFGANSYTIFRKAEEDTSWGTPLAVLPGAQSRYTDTTVAVGLGYEYQVVKAGTLGYTGYGYIYSGIEVPPTEDRGTLILVVATNSTLGLDYELGRLQQDLAGDGWQVLRHDVSSNDAPESVRSLVLGDYWSDPANVNTLFLLGHVPILQSGYIDYDGHGARAMPADAYYGDVYYDWPTTPTNSPSYLPSYVPLKIGRVDLFDMPGSGSLTPWPNETELLRNYLNKDHAWRQKLFSVPRKALMGNRRGDEAGLAVAASGYRAFEPLVGPGNTQEANIDDAAPAAQRWASELAAAPYLWAYGCGAGQDTAISYLGVHDSYQEVWSTDVVSQNATAVFVMVFGSHLGNWDHQDNIMRSVLASPGTGLACCMSGEPHWFFHHMGLGETIGYSARLSLNNTTLYSNQVNPYTNAVYIALMGDPSLRMEPVAPPGALNATNGPAGLELSWAASSDPVAGYYLYRSGSPAGPFYRVTEQLLTGNSYLDQSVTAGIYTYMVRAIALTSNPSGSYYNPSQGAFVTVMAQTPAPPIQVGASLTPNGLLLTWSSAPGAVYHVESSSDVNAATWANISGSITGTGATTSWLDTTSSARPRSYYRVASP